VDLARVVFIEASERIFYHVLGIGSLKSFAEQSEKHGEVDLTRSLVHHRLKIVVVYILAKGSKHVLQIVFVDESIVVLINEAECLLELLNLRLIEHGEDIGRGSLGAFLDETTAFALLGGGHHGRSITAIHVRSRGRELALNEIWIS